MNTTLDNDTLDDDMIIARLRSALDELAAPADDLLPMRTRTTASPTRWLAIAAAAILVVAGIAAIAVNRNNAPTAEEPTDTTSPAPSTTMASTQTTLVGVTAAWYTIVAADLVPGEVTFQPCCVPASDAHELAMAWQRSDDGAYLTLGVFSNDEYGYRAGNTLREVDGLTRVFESYGLTAAEREELADQVVAGSGLPYVLPVEGWGVVGIGMNSAGQRQTQLYTSANPDPLSSYLPTVTLSVGEYYGELAWLARYLNPEAITVAGNDGWSIVDADGNIDVIWPTPDGSWANLHIDAQLARRADGIILAVTEVDPSQPTVETVPIPGDTPVITIPPQLAFTRSFEDEFTPEDVQAIRAENPEYQNSPMMTISGLDAGGRIDLEGRVEGLPDNSEYVVTLLYFVGDSSNPTWSLSSSPGLIINCTGGETITVRGDDSGCDAGIVQQWIENDTKWTLHGPPLTSGASPIDQFEPAA